MIVLMMLMSFGLIVPLLLIGVVAYALARRPQVNQTGRAHTKQTPLEVLKARYAGGEISRDEYEQMRRDLEG
jgi:putative membrane protein